MINKLFYSPNNKNAIKSIICENINIKINNRGCLKCAYNKFNKK